MGSAGGRGISSPQLENQNRVLFPEQKYSMANEVSQEVTLNLYADVFGLEEFVNSIEATFTAKTGLLDATKWSSRV